MAQPIVKLVNSAKLGFLVLLVVSFSALVFQNQDSWQVKFLWYSGNIPAIVLLFLTAAAGFISGITVSLLMKHKGKN